MNSKLVWGFVLLVGLLTPGVQAQLAITEVMSSASWEVWGGATNRRPDYWELTNFGTNTLSLDGYSFSDVKQKTKLNFDPFRGVTISNGESIVFFRFPDEPYGRSTITNAARFREWWGQGTLTNYKILTYKSPGLNGTYGDQLWFYNRQTNVVDVVLLGQARQGRSFVPEADTGLFGALSNYPQDGAVIASYGADVGSPGTHPPAVPLEFDRHPSDQTADAGGEVTFSASALGLPRPKYQWLWNGLVIPDATSNSFTITDLQPEHAGQYRVWIYNGLMQATSDVAMLLVEVTNRPPVLVQAPADLTVFPGQTAVFSGAARGYPALSYQWQSNGVDIAGATTRSLILPNAAEHMSGVLYTLRISNACGETNASAVLRVVPKPSLRVSEVMANPLGGDSSLHYDWFELTNGGTNTVDLMGYRFFDSLTFEGAYTISKHLYMRPGESVVFVEEMSPEEFWAWWGPENGQMGVQVYTYHGFSLGMVKGDIYLWNAAALDPVDTTAMASWASLEFGLSQECDTWCEPETGCDAMCPSLLNSVVGVNGAYRTPPDSQVGDVGSPGFVINPPPRILSVRYDGAGVLLKCRVIPGKAYELKSVSSLTNSWINHGSYDATSHLLEIETPVGGDGARFYKLLEID